MKHDIHKEILGSKQVEQLNDQREHARNEGPRNKKRSSNCEEKGEIAGQISSFPTMDEHDVNM